MPPKIRELIKRLKSAGFQNRGGKGSHRNYLHPDGAGITLSGGAGNDAKRYQVREVELAIKLVIGKTK